MTVSEDVALVREMFKNFLDKERYVTNSEIKEAAEAFARLDDALITGAATIPEEWFSHTKNYIWLMSNAVRTVRRWDPSYLAENLDRVYFNLETRLALMDALHFFADEEDKKFYEPDSKGLQYGGIRIRTIRLIREIDPSCSLFEAKAVMQSIFNPIEQDIISGRKEGKEDY